MRRGCYGCFGPAALSFPAGRQGPNCSSLANSFEQGLAMQSGEIGRKFRLIHRHKYKAEAADD
jgi:hypothetical protein